MIKNQFNAFKRDSIGFVASRISSIWYNIKCFFSPYNVVKVKNLSRTWSDRDSLMFHAMFQILVDFVELEQPFISWDDQRKLKLKRHTNIEEMKAWNEKLYGPEGHEQFYSEWYTEEEKRSQDKHTHKQYIIQKEILYLYEWYKNKKYEYDTLAMNATTGEKLEFSNNGIRHVPNGKPALITWQELHEAEEEHSAICNRMLERILVVRENLWT